MHFQIQKLINSIWNREEVPKQRKESIIAPICKQGHKTHCRNYSGTQLLSTTYKILSNILLSVSTPYTEEMIGDHQCGSQHNRSTTYHVFFIWQILKEKKRAKWHNASTVYKLQESL
jgi:hypothetical protein